MLNSVYRLQMLSVWLLVAKLTFLVGIYSIASVKLLVSLFLVNSLPENSILMYHIYWFFLLLRSRCHFPKPSTDLELDC